MAEIRKYFTEIRKAVFGKRINRAFYNGKEILRMIYNGAIVFDRQEFLLSVDDHVDIEASGTGDMPLWSVIGFLSYKFDYKGKRTFVDFMGADEIIDPNDTGSAKHGEFTIVQDITGFTLSGTWTQMANEFQNYSFKRIESVEVNYEELPYVGTSSPYVSVTAVLTMHYSNESTEDVTRTYVSGIEVTSAQGNDGGTNSGATIDSSTGVVSIGAPSEVVGEPVFYVTSLGGTVNIPELTDDNLKEWSWNGSIEIMQTEDQRVEYGTPTYTLSAWLDSDELEATDTLVVVHAVATKTSYYYYESDPDNILEETTDETLYVLLDENVSDSRRITGEGSTRFEVGVNESTEEQRTFSVHVYHSDKNLYDKTFTVTQSANSATGYWGTPSLNGDVVVEEILADGTGQPIFVPIIQKKYARAEGTETDTLVETFTGSVEATAIGGTPVDGTGVSFSNGEIYADSLGRTETSSARKVYTLSSVTITGKDGGSYTFNLPSHVEIFQARNTRHSISQGYVLTVSANPSSGISNLGGASTISYSAQEKYSVYFDADPAKTAEYSNVSATLGTDAGTLSATSVSGSGTTTLSLGENVAGARTATVTLSKDSASKSCTVSQYGVVYILKAGDDQECNATESTVYVTFESSRNGKVWEPAFTTNLSGAVVGTPTLSGTTYTVPVTIPQNEDADARDIVVTATQTRYDGDATATVTITQAGAAVPKPVAGVVLEECIYSDDSLSSVYYSMYFTAYPADEYHGGTMHDVVVMLNSAINGTGEVISSKEIGDVTVSRGSNSSTYSGALKADGRVVYLLVYWGGSLQFATEIEEASPNE